VQGSSPIQNPTPYVAIQWSILRPKICRASSVIFYSGREIRNLSRYIIIEYLMKLQQFHFFYKDGRYVGFQGYLLPYGPFSIRSNGPDWDISFTVCVMARQTVIC
jgi:hypothetical protein